MKNFFKKLFESMKAHKGRTIGISITAFLLICAIVAISCLSAFLFNRFPKGFIPSDAQLAAINDNPANQYKRVVIIGVDGVGDFFSKTYTPNFDKMFSDKTTAGGTEIKASVTYRGVAIYPTISCENWMSIFHGVRPAYHGFLFRNTNQRVEAGEHTNESKYPSFMGLYLRANPNDKILSVCTWRGVNNGIIENDDRITKYNTTVEEIHQFLNGEPVLACINEKNERVAAPILDADGSLRAYLEEETRLQGYSDETIAMRDAITMQRVIEETTSDPDRYRIAYMHLDQVDHAGHSFGYSKPGYVNAVSRVDLLVGKLYDAYEKAGMLDDTLFILCTDHGHRLPGGHKNHGKNTDLEVNVTFAIAGKTVKSGKPTKYVNTDLAAIVCYVLGVKQNKNWQGRVPYNMFAI